MPIAAVLFDFDGTLVDTRTASWPLFAETSRVFDLGIETREQFFALFEHNIYESLARHCGDAARAQAAAQHFLDLVRDHYAPPFIDGIDGPPVPRGGSPPPPLPNIRFSRRLKSRQSSSRSGGPSLLPPPGRCGGRCSS